MATFCVSCPKCSPYSRGSTLVPEHSNEARKNLSVAFNHGSNLNASLMSRSVFNNLGSFGVQLLKKKQSCVWKVQALTNEVVVKESSNSAPVLEPKTKEESGSTISDESSISAFITQVADLVKLVDSRDIAELQLKQQDCEILIRKKAAMPQQPPAAASPVYQMQSSPQPPPPPQAIAPAATPAPPPAKSNASSHPPLKCPMAGTFYRCSGPSEPPFVKVGDKVQKGQVICIIEAMKLMNEIEADQSGTVVEILAEDAKPVSVDTPLLVIAP